MEDGRWKMEDGTDDVWSVGGLRGRMRDRRLLLNLSFLVACASTIGCNTAPRQPSGPYETIGKDPHRDADIARQENARAVALIDAGDYPAAETALKAALSADIMCGPAHNNLGKVYYRQSRLYLAAWEFQYAMKLMPNQPEPLNNLGLVFEAAGKLDEAADHYGKAVALEPDNIHAMGNLARARVRRGDRDPEVRALLGKLVLRETRPNWLAWERSTLSRLETRPTE
jgi:Flp pilus assembly protein TadD